MNDFILKRINKGVEKYHELAEWMVKLFSIDKIFDEYFLNNPYRDTKKTLAYWINGLSKICSPETRLLFCNSLVNRLTFSNENNVEVCLILYEMAGFDMAILNHLVKNNIMARMITNFTKKKSNFKDMLEVPMERESEIGYEEEIPRSAFEELKIKKIRMGDNDNEYVWNLMGLIVDQCVVNHRHLKEILSEEEIECVYGIDSRIYKVLEEVRSKNAIFSFSKFIAHLSVNN